MAVMASSLSQVGARLLDVVVLLAESDRCVIACLPRPVVTHLESLRLAVRAPPDEFDDRFRVMHAQSVHHVVQEGEPVSAHGDVDLPVWSGGAITIVCIPQQHDDGSTIVLGLAPASRKHVTGRRNWVWF